MRLRGATSVAAATTTIRRRRTPFLAYDSACGGDDELRRWGRRDTLVRRLEWGGVSVTVKSGGEE